MIRLRLVEPGEIGGVNQRQIPHLLPAEPLQHGYRLPQILRPHPAGGQLIAQRHQLPQKGGLPAGPGVHRQLRRRLLQCQLHQQQLPPRVQRTVGEPPGHRQHPAGQQPQAEHLGIPPGGGTANPAEIHLRLV